MLLQINASLTAAIALGGACDNSFGSGTEEGDSPCRRAGKTLREDYWRVASFSTRKSITSKSPSKLPAMSAPVMYLPFTTMAGTPEIL